MKWVARHILNLPDIMLWSMQCVHTTRARHTKLELVFAALYSKPRDRLMNFKSLNMTWRFVVQMSFVMLP